MADQHNNQLTLAKMAMVAVVMFGFGYALVPLYDMLCEVTGLNGKTGDIAEAEAKARYEIDENRWVTVQFLANKNGAMPWEFGPTETQMRVHPGKVYQTAYIASNRGQRDMVGQAVPSVAPGKASRFFNKTECFCFDNQPLAAGETKEMPIRFVVDPRLPKGVGQVTLSYTFFDVTGKVDAEQVAAN